jgi:hypothetical protein
MDVPGRDGATVESSTADEAAASISEGAPPSSADDPDAEVEVT